MDIQFCQFGDPSGLFPGIYCSLLKKKSVSFCNLGVELPSREVICC